VEEKAKMTSRIEIIAVSKKFTKKEALFDFSLIANEGECIALCGGNGAGKSTLLQIVAGISHPSKGKVIVDKVDLLQNRKAYVSRIGYMPDEFIAQETMTVTEFLTFYAKFRKIGLRRVKEVIQVLGLEEKKDEMLKHLSKGMRQRLLFGQAWIGNPPVLILDEPTNGLDPYWIDIFTKLVFKIKNSGTTILFSTHMMDVAAEVADQVIFMEKGKQISVLENDFQNEKLFMDKLLQFYRKKVMTEI
jgi:ABC-2 type transport system ATP-binding protein